MSLFDQSTLTQFTGTERYYRISRRHLLTDGTKYLAENAECFWMMDAVASHLMEIGTVKWTPKTGQQFKWDTVTRNGVNHDRDQKAQRSPARVQSQGGA